MTSQAERDQRFVTTETKNNPDDLRSPFAHDRDRILYSDAFRRLSGVTQVVSAHEGQVFHNRLTHTLKVAQLSRRMAENFLLKESDKDLALQLGLDAEVAEAAGLAHDLGHPPFGHIAEEVLDEKVRSKKNHDGYEGNAQSFRIVTSLSARGQEHNGLNLTRATMQAILKYPWMRDHDEQGQEKVGSEKRYRKYGAYRTSEQEQFRFATGSIDPSERTLEAEIMDWADDITYAVHDVVDFYRAGLIPLHALSDRERWDEFTERATSRKSFNQDRFNLDNVDVDSFIALFPTGSYDGSRNSQREAASLTGTLISLFVKAISLKESSTSEPQTVLIRPEERVLVDLLKELTWIYVIERPSLAGQQHGQRRIIRTLFDVYYESEEHLIPETYRELSESNGRARIAADVIAGMTEAEAVSMYARLMGIDVGSIFDPIVGR